MELLAAEEEDEGRMPDDGELEGSGDNYVGLTNLFYFQNNPY